MEKENKRTKKKTTLQQIQTYLQSYRTTMKKKIFFSIVNV